MQKSFFKHFFQPTKNDKTALFVLTGLLLASAVLYATSVNATVRNVVARQNLETDLSYTQSEITALEVAIIDKQEAVDRSLALEMGFTDQTEPRFVDVDRIGLSLTQHDASR